LLIGCQKAPDTLKKAKETISAEAAAFHKEVREHLDKFEKQYEQWKAKAATATGEAKEKMTAQLAELDPYKAKAKEQFTKLESASGDMWKAAKEDMNKAVAGMKEAFEKGKEHFK
jgi:hypothetical protein